MGQMAVEHYFTIPSNVKYLNDTNPTIGITNAVMRTYGGNSAIVCQYTRANQMDNNANYFNVNNASPFMLAAYGKLSNGKKSFK